MSLDDVAMAVLGLDPANMGDVDRVALLLAQLPGKVSLSESALVLLNEAKTLVETFKSGTDCDAASVNKLNALIARLQESMEAGSENTPLFVNQPAVPSASRATAPAAPEPPAVPNFPAQAGTPVDTKAPLAAAAELEGDSLADADPEILSEFITETLDHLQISETSLLKLETDPDDKENLNTVFRAFHSTKGTSSFLGLNRIKELAHHGEMLLDRARKGEIQLTGVFADLALESADTLKWMIQTLQDASTGPRKPLPANYQDLMRRLESPGEIKTQKKAAAGPGADAPVSTGAEVKVQIIPATVEIKPETSPVIHDAPERPCNDTMTNALNPGSGAAAASTVRVSTEKLDGLINMVGELVITHAMIAQQEGAREENQQNRTFSKNISQLEKITRELQDLSMSLRMVPLKATFQKMERLVRDVAKKSQKQVVFRMEGEDTEIDRNMVETINDPLVHMLRNSVDHGIESPEVRKAAGKPEAGTVLLRAYHTSGNIVIELHDDGKGLDRTRIFNKAVEKKLVDPEHTLSDSEVFKLIFLPGFSTAEKVTEVSGRGVGLDVVKKNIESIRGRIEINSAPGQNTLFAMRIPLTLAIIDGMLLKVGAQQYLLPTLNVKHAFRPEASALFTVAGKGEMVKLRDKLIPIFRLYQMFGVSGAVEDPTRALLLMVEHEGEVCALLADALLGQQQLVIKSLPAGVGKESGASGAAILGDGRISLILDVASILLLARGGRRTERSLSW